MNRYLIAAALLSFAFAAPARAQAPYWEPHWQSRMSTIDFQSATVGQGKTLLLGDSLTEAFWWTIVSGQCWIINAGFGGAPIRIIADNAPTIAEQTRPRTVHVMIGTNNIGMAHSDPQWASLATDLRRITTAFAPYGSTIVWWPVPPMSQASAPAGYAENRAHINNLIQQEASATGALWDWWFPTTITDTNGYAIAGALNGDGVHFSASTQAARYNRIEAWRQHIQSQTGMGCQ